MMAFQDNASLPPADALGSDGASRYSPHGPDAAKYLAYRNFGMRARGGHCSNDRRKLPVIQPLSKPRDWRTLLGGFLVGGSPNLASEVSLEPDNNDLNKDICGIHLHVVNQCARLERTRTVIPQLSRNYQVHRPGNLHPCSLSKELSHSHSGQPFTRGYHKRYDVNTTPALFPSTNTFTVENCKLSSRPLVKYPTTPNLLNVKDYQQSARLERTRTVIPQLSRNYQVHRPGNLHPCSLSKELSHSHSGRPFTRGYHKRYDVNTTPALFPSTNNLTVEKCKLSSRSLVKYPTTPNLLNVKDYQQSQSYPDPVVGASRSFIHRVSELSSLEGETARQEKLKRMRKPKKTPP